MQKGLKHFNKGLNTKLSSMLQWATTPLIPEGDQMNGKQETIHKVKQILFSKDGLKKCGQEEG